MSMRPTTWSLLMSGTDTVLWKSNSAKSSRSNSVRRSSSSELMTRISRSSIACRVDG